MNSASASLQLDQRAMALLARLLQADAAEREAELRRLRDTDPALQARVQRLLAAASDSGSTAALAAPVHAGPLDAAGLAAGSRGATWQAGDLIAGYRLVRPLGQGGMATVWLAERADGQLKRQVAIKLPLAADLSGLLAERFARERDVLAALDHPHIARLIDAGVADAARGAQPYIVLECVDGVPITEYAAALGLRDKLALFLQVLAAIEHAHRHMTVHRDLKPGNILVDGQGQVKLLDFGIAKLLAPPAGMGGDLTHDAASVLTPRYAAPEQVLGGAVSTATDVYSAGVVLYELLTGRTPQQSRRSALEPRVGLAPAASATPAPPPPNLAQLLHAVAHDEAQPPGLGTDIDTVLLKALRKAPAERYASIERFAEDLRRLLAHQPILARRVPAWQRVRLLLRRHPAASLAVSLGAVLLVAASTLAWQQQRETQAQKARAEAVRAFVFNMVSDAEPAQGKTEVTGLEMVDAAVANARQQFAGDPRLLGELLAELGRVYFRLRQPQASVATLEEALRLLAGVARPDDAALNRTRAVLAQSLVSRDDARAAALADQALAECTRRDADCAEARARAHYAKSIVASWAGQYPQALEQARAMVRQSELAFGAGHLYMQPALETLASAARNSGSLQEAAQTVQRAQLIASKGTLKAGYRQRLDLLQAVIEVDLGQYGAARQHLLTLLQAVVDDAVERSIQWRWLAAAESGLGHAEAALAAAAQARQLAPPDNAIGALALQAWGDAASHAGQHAAALQAMADAQAGLLKAGMQASSPAMLRLRRQWAEALLRGGQPDAARQALLQVRQAHRDAAAPHRAEWALGLDALACAQAEVGQGEASREALAEAGRQHAQALPDAHPLRLRHLALAALLREEPAARREAALARWRGSLGADGPQHPAGVADCSGLV